jgi:AcrR family transcriptional regulator
MPREERTPTRRPGQLPPGRHNLPREYVAESQRSRILDGVIEAVAEFGYHQARLHDVITAAGVSRKTFYEYYKDLDDAFLAAYDMHVTALTEAVQQAFVGEGAERSGRGGRPRGWPDQIRDGVRAFLGYLVDNPEAAKVALIDALGASKEARARRDAALRSFTFFVDSGRGEAAYEVPGRTALAVIGGANELIAWEILHGSPAKVGSLAPDIVYMIVLPFLGPKKALAQREKAVAELEAQGGGRKAASGAARGAKKRAGAAPAKRARKRSGR